MYCYSFSLHMFWYTVVMLQNASSARLFGWNNPGFARRLWNCRLYWSTLLIPAVCGFKTHMHSVKLITHFWLKDKHGDREAWAFSCTPYGALTACVTSLRQTQTRWWGCLKEGGGQMKRKTMTEQQCVSLQPRAMCSMLTAWLGSVPEAYSEPRTAPLVSALAHLGETHLDKVSLSLFIAPVFPFSKTRSISSGSPHLAALSSFVCRSIRTPRGTSNL